MAILSRCETYSSEAQLRVEAVSNVPLANSTFPESHKTLRSLTNGSGSSLNPEVTDCGLDFAFCSWAIGFVSLSVIVEGSLSRDTSPSSVSSGLSVVEGEFFR